MMERFFWFRHFPLDCRPARRNCHMDGPRQGMRHSRWQVRRLHSGMENTALRGRSMLGQIRNRAHISRAHGAVQE